MFYGVRLGEKMGLKLKYTGSVDIGGAIPVALVQHAVMAINAGLCNTVVCVYAGIAKKQPKRTPESCPQIVNNEDEFIVSLRSGCGYARICNGMFNDICLSSGQPQNN